MPYDAQWVVFFTILIRAVNEITSNESKVICSFFEKETEIPLHFKNAVIVTAQKPIKVLVTRSFSHCTSFGYMDLWSILVI